MKRSHFWFGGGLSIAALYLAFRQVDAGKMAAALVQADYLLIAAAAGLQLLVIGAIAGRWRLFFRQRPEFSRLVSSLLIAQLANGVIPVRLGMLVRAYLVGREEGQSKIAVLATVVAEKVFDSLVFVLFFAAILPVFAPDWFHWSSLRLSTGLFVAIFPVMVLLTYQRRHALRLVRAVLERVRWAERIGLLQKLESGLEGLTTLQGRSALAMLWVWTLVIAGLGILVNYSVMRAFAVEAPWVAAVFLLVALQIGGKVLPAAPLGGIGIFQYICMEALALFDVDRETGLSFAFVLHFVVYVPGSILGALALYRSNFSLRRLKQEAVEADGGNPSQD